MYRPTQLQIYEETSAKNELFNTIFEMENLFSQDINNQFQSIDEAQNQETQNVNDSHELEISNRYQVIDTMETEINESNTEHDMMMQNLNDSHKSKNSNRYQAIDTMETEINELNTEHDMTMEGIRDRYNEQRDQVMAMEESVVNYAARLRECEDKRQPFDIDGLAELGEPGSATCSGKAYFPDDETCAQQMEIPDGVNPVEIATHHTSNTLLCPDLEMCKELGNYGECQEYGYDGDTNKGMRFDPNFRNIGFTSMNDNGEISHACPAYIPCYKPKKSDVGGKCWTSFEEDETGKPLNDNNCLEELVCARKGFDRRMFGGCMDDPDKPDSIGRLANDDEEPTHHCCVVPQEELTSTFEQCAENVLNKIMLPNAYPDHPCFKMENGVRVPRTGDGDMTDEQQLNCVYETASAMRYFCPQYEEIVEEADGMQKAVGKIPDMISFVEKMVEERKNQPLDPNLKTKLVKVIMYDSYGDGAVTNDANQMTTIDVQGPAGDMLYIGEKFTTGTGPHEEEVTLLCNEKLTFTCDSRNHGGWPQEISFEVAGINYQCDRQGTTHNITIPCDDKPMDDAEEPIDVITAEPPFVELTSGSGCMASGYVPVETLQECRDAMNSLGLSYEGESTSENPSFGHAAHHVGMDKNLWPYGCYTFNNTLYFNNYDFEPDALAHGNVCDQDYKCICKHATAEPEEVSSCESTQNESGCLAMEGCADVYNAGPPYEQYGVDDNGNELPSIFCRSLEWLNAKCNEDPPLPEPFMWNTEEKQCVPIDGA